MEKTLASKISLHKSHIAELSDILLVPTSLLRYAHKLTQAGMFNPDENDSKTMQIFAKIYPYASAACLEGIRLTGYLSLAKSFYNILSNQI